MNNIKDKMESGLLCPVCRNFMKVETYVECMGTVEETHKCPHCGYFYWFSYGNYMEIVNRREFVWSYTSYSNKEDFKKFQKMIQKHIKLHQLKWKLYRANYLYKEPYFTYCFPNNKGEKIKRLRGGI